MADGEHIAKAKATFLGTEDHGIFTASVELDFGGAGQSFGNYDLRGQKCWEFLNRTCRAFNAESWEKIPGHTVIAVVRGGIVREIKPLPTEGGKAFDAEAFMSR